jgi:hypothetical protein
LTGKTRKQVQARTKQVNPLAKFTVFKVDYYRQAAGSGSKARSQMTGSVSQHLHQAVSENAVYQYLKAKHPGYEITIMKLDWS